MESEVRCFNILLYPFPPVGNSLKSLGVKPKNSITSKTSLYCFKVKESQSIETYKPLENLLP